MHGIGNDYVYINCFQEKINNPEALAIKLSHRNFSIGGDGIILIMPSETADFRMRMFNLDGSEGKMCGNGVRCVAKYVYDKGLTDKKTVSLETLAGIKTFELTVQNGVVTKVCVDMGEPILEAAKIPVKADVSPVINQQLKDFPYKGTCVSMGNPHVIFFVDEITDEMIHVIGRRIETDPIFPEKVNVEFVKVNSRTDLTMRVWERGSGETLACGTGASAVGVAAALNNLAEKKVTVHLLGGDLEIEWKEDNHVYMTGGAEIAFEGTVEIED